MGSEMTILVKRPKGAQWCTCAGKVPSFSRTPDGMSQTIYPRKRERCPEFVYIYLFLVLFCLVMKRVREKTRDMSLVVCFMDPPQQIRIIFHSKLHKQLVTSNNI